MSLLQLSDALTARPGDLASVWARVTSVEIGTTITVVYFSILGAPGTGALSAATEKLARVGVLNPGDKIQVERYGQGSWLIIDKIQRIEGNE